MVRQVRGDYRCGEPRLQPLLREALRLKALFDSAEVRHVYREDNAPADELANLAVDVDEAISEVGRLEAAGRAGGRLEVVDLLARRMQIEGR